MTRLLESIDRFVDNNVNLSDEQKKEVKDFFRKHPDLNGLVNWQKEGVLLKYADFRKIMDDYTNRKHEQVDGLSQIKEGVDYKIVYNSDGVTAYEVLTYKGSCVLASNNVSPEVWSDVDENYKNAPGFERNVVKDYPQKVIDGNTLYGGAKWCTAYKNTDSHWNEYQQARMKFVYIIGNVPTGKVALAYLPKENWGRFYEILNGNYTLNQLNPQMDNTPIHAFFDTCFKTLPLELILRQNVRSMWNAYNEEVTGNIEYDDVENIATEIVGSSAVADSIKLFMNVIGAEKDGRMWSRRKGIRGDRTANFIKEHHMNRRYMVKEGKLRAKWNYWEGDFDCSGWGLETLENMPRHITGDFICKDNLEDFTEADIPKGVVIQGRKIFE